VDLVPRPTLQTINLYGATFVAGSLHGPWSAVPIAAKRSQYFVPLVSPEIVAFERVTTSASDQHVAPN
jgi:hypothetical protein